MRRIDFALAVFVAFVAAWPAQAKERPRFRMVRDPASRYGFEHVQDRETGLWAHLHCELRVASTRRLPEPPSTPETGDLISFTQFTSLSMGSAGIVPAEFVVRDGMRTWRWRVLADEAMLDGRAALGVRVSWPGPPDAERRDEPMEVFALPALNTLEPYRWSAWRTADELRGGFFAGWEKLHGRAPDGAALPAEPFALRCRPVLADYLYVPVESDDANVGRPEPPR